MIDGRRVVLDLSLMRERRPGALRAPVKLVTGNPSRETPDNGVSGRNTVIPSCTSLERRCDKKSAVTKQGSARNSFFCYPVFDKFIFRCSLAKYSCSLPADIIRHAPPSEKISFHFSKNFLVPTTIKSHNPLSP